MRLLLQTLSRRLLWVILDFHLYRENVCLYHVELTPCHEVKRPRNIGHFFWYLLHEALNATPRRKSAKRACCSNFILSVRSSVCLSVSLMHSIEDAEHIVKLLSPPALYHSSFLMINFRRSNSQQLNIDLWSTKICDFWLLFWERCNTRPQLRWKVT